MIPWYLVLILIVLAFVAGALVYRNNAKRLEAELARAERNYDALYEEFSKVVKKK